MPHGSKQKSVDLGLNQFHEVVVLAPELKLEPELELVLVLEWVLRLALKLMICGRESGDGERVPPKTKTPTWRRCNRVTGRREPSTRPTNRSLLID